MLKNTHTQWDFNTAYIYWNVKVYRIEYYISYFVVCNGNMWNEIALSGVSVDVHGDATLHASACDVHVIPSLMSSCFPVFAAASNQSFQVYPGGPRGAAFSTQFTQLTQFAQFAKPHRPLATTAPVRHHVHRRGYDRYQTVASISAQFLAAAEERWVRRGRPQTAVTPYRILFASVCPYHPCTVTE